MDEKSDAPKYLIAIQRKFVVLTFIENLGKEAHPYLQECMEEIFSSSCTHLIVNFRGVSEINRRIYRDIVQLQATIRTKHKGLVRVCGVEPLVKKLLIENGVIRETEISRNVKTSILELTKIKVKG